MPDARPTSRTLISKTLNRLKTRGLREVAPLASARAKEWLSSGDTLLMYVRETESLDTAVREGLEFREASRSDAGRYAREIGTDSASSFSNRLSERTHCFVVDDGQMLVHASWMTTGGAWTREIKAYLVPPPGDGYIYESFTRADARGRGIYPFALRGLLAWGASHDLRRLWVAVEEHNAASIRAVTKAGFAEAFRLPYARRLGRLRIEKPSGTRAAEAATFLSRTPPR